MAATTTFSHGVMAGASGSHGVSGSLSPSRHREVHHQGDHCPPGDATAATSATTTGSGSSGQPMMVTSICNLRDGSVGGLLTLALATPSRSHSLSSMASQPAPQSDSEGITASPLLDIEGERVPVAGARRNALLAGNAAVTASLTAIQPQAGTANGHHGNRHHRANASGARVAPARSPVRPQQLRVASGLAGGGSGSLRFPPARELPVVPAVPHLWHLSAGPLSLVPSVGSLVVYCADGHLQNLMVRAGQGGGGGGGEGREEFPMAVHQAEAEGIQEEVSGREWWGA